MQLWEILHDELSLATSSEYTEKLCSKNESYLRPNRLSFASALSQTCECDFLPINEVSFGFSNSDEEEKKKKNKWRDEKNEKEEETREKIVLIKPTLND